MTLCHILPERRGWVNRIICFFSQSIAVFKISLRSVCIDSTLLDVKNQEEGIPQDSILSTTLFNIKINNVIKELTSGIDGSLYYEPMICFKSKYIHTIERKLPQRLKKINRWTTENGFRFSKTKQNVSIFVKKKKLHNNPSLKLESCIWIQISGDNIWQKINIYSPLEISKN